MSHQHHDGEKRTGAGWAQRREPYEQGGNEYWVCGGCGREILVSIGRTHLLHEEGCPNARRSA